MRAQNIGLSVAECRLLRQGLEVLRGKVCEQAHQNGGGRAQEASQATYEVIDELVLRLELAEQRLRRARNTEAERVGAGLPF